MADVRYAPGSWVAVAGTGLWVLAEVDGAAPVVRTLWELILDGRPMNDLLGAIMHEGFRTVGNFAIVERAGGVRIVVRGRATVELGRTSGDPETVSDPDVATWLDVSVDGPVAWLRLTADQSVAPQRLPLSSGVVLASEVRIGLVPEQPAPERVVAPEPITTPEPVAVVQPITKPEPIEESAEPEPGFDHLFGATQHAVQEPPPERLPELRGEPVKIGADTLPAVVEEAGVIMDLSQAISSRQPAPAQPALASPRHAVADKDIAMTVRRRPAAPDAAQPVLGVLRLSTGDVIPLDRGVIMGREPHPPDGDDRSWHRVRLPSPGNDISRNHVEVRTGDRQVLVTDLGSTNGTEVTVPGMTAWPLQPNEPMPIEPGTVVSLAGEISFTFEVTA